MESETYCGKYSLYYSEKPDEPMQHNSPWFSHTVHDLWR